MITIIIIIFIIIFNIAVIQKKRMYVVIYKLAWKGLLVSNYHHCTHAIPVVCICASPLHKVCCILPFCTTHPPLKFFQCDDSVAGPKVDLWLNCPDYLLPNPVFANHLVSCCMAHTLQWSMDKLIIIIGLNAI